MASPLLYRTLLVRASSAHRTAGSNSAGCHSFTEPRRLRFSPLAGTTGSSTLIGETRARRSQGASREWWCSKADPVKALHLLPADSGERVEEAAFSNAGMRLNLEAI